ncbi:MAG: tRNA (guanosine(46)-N7)-methyltransferase TrmB [Saprospiraceae bacterium]|nr:tRNA (guanosine(46)-N7)-methyltransferase TrmB [Saprospiraceae bacterium]
MSRRSKLEKFAELLTFRNVYQNYDPKKPTLRWVNGNEVDRRSNWSKHHFQNDHPITLELACGGGEYTLALARSHPERNFIGIDIKGNRIWKGARQALSEKLANVAFLRTRIEQIDLFFGPDEVSEIWITFPDPFVRKSKANRRLTNINFLNKYRTFIKAGGYLHLKTDSDPLYKFTLELVENCDYCRLLEATTDIYVNPLTDPDLGITTFYEKQHLAAGKKIKYLRFEMDGM